MNAATRRKDLEWIGPHSEGFDAAIEDRSEQYALLALQGPNAASILARRTRADLDAIRPFRFVPAKISGTELILARTGYTGEDGFELFVDSEQACGVWVDLLEAGSDLGLQPAGLGARDILRLEMGYALYGADLDEDHTALEAGLGWVVKLDKGDFVGRAALSRQREAGVPRRLVGIQMSERGFPRPGYPVTVKGEVVGAVTSGTVSPSLDCGIAMAYVPAGLADPGTSLAVRIRDRDLAGVVAKLPFYKGGSRKR